MAADIVIHDAFVLTVDERNWLYERGTVLIEDGRIAEVWSSQDDDTDIAAARVIDGEGKLVMPGLVNAHTHLELTPLLGAFSDLNLTEMMGSMTAIYGQIADGEFDYLTEAGYELAALNFPAGGVTTVNSIDVRPSTGAETFGEARQARLTANLKRSAGQYDSMELVRMLTIEGVEALGISDEIGSLEPDKRADIILPDVEQPKFTPLTNVPAQVANNAAPADVGTVIVDGDVLMRDGEVKTVDVDAVGDRVETAADRFESEADWELGIGGARRRVRWMSPVTCRSVARPVARAACVPVGQDRFSF